MSIDGTLTNVKNFNSDVVDFNSNNGILTVTTSSTMEAYSDGFSLEASLTGLTDQIYELQSGFAFNNNFYLGTTEIGMFEVPFDSSIGTQILPNGPLLNNTFALDASPGQLWTVFGEVDASYNPFPLNYRGISNLRDGAWTNIGYDELSEVFDGKPINDLVKVKINPQNPNETYISSYQKGLLKIEGQTPVFLFDQTNSSLEYPPFLPTAALGIRLYGSDFDRQGNLWFLQSRYNNGLIKLSPQGQFQKIDVTEIIEGEEEQAFTELAIGRSGNVFFGTAESGLIGYNPNNGRFNRIVD
jgi:hypothetical protein